METSKITNGKFEKYVKLFKIACEKRNVDKKKYNWKKLSLDKKKIISEIQCVF